MRKIVAALLLNLVCAIAVAQAPDPGNYSAAKYDLVERRGVVVTMRDGVRLSADIYTPKAAEQWPAILNILPYNRGIVREDARWYAKRGYVVVVVDSRGTYNSEGAFDPFDPKHKTDGYDLVEWIARQAWSSGKVGMMGASYGGWTQWWTASTAPPHLVAIAPEGAPPDAFENVPYQNGALVGWILDWAAMMSGRTLQLTGDGRYGGWGEHRLQDYRQTPYIDINARRGLESAPWLPQWYQQNRSTDPYWSAIAYQSHYSQMTVPSLAFTGWFDVDYPGSPANYTGMKQFGATPEARRPTLIIGPWTHVNYKREISGVDFGPDAAIDAHGYIVRWFDHFLKGIDNGVEKDPPVYVFVMGENRWHAERDWPLPEAVPTKYYLESSGVLTARKPRKEGVDQYVYDPKTPTLDPYNGFPGSTGGIDAMLDTSGSTSGALVYQTPPLESPVEVTGPIEATLYAATSARDTDWMVRLVDVQPDGRSLLLTDGVIRARSRDPAHEGRFNAAQLSTIEPDHVYQYTIRFWRGTGNLFKQGHRIRVEISSSWFPYYLPNLNTGADNLALVSMADAVVAHQKIYHGARYPSSLELPVVPPRRPSSARGVDPRSLIPPELLQPLDAELSRHGKLVLNTSTLASVRKRDEAETPPIQSSAFERRVIPGPAGNPHLNVYTINTSDKGARKPAILYIHGGGYVSGTVGKLLPNLQKLAQELDCVVVSVDYRLAPDTPFPGSLEDNYAALKWLWHSASELGVDTRRIAVMGESAGGGHAAMLAIAVRDRNEFSLVAQILIYPMLDDRTGSSRSVPAHIGAYIWTPASNRFGWSSLLGQPPGADEVPYGSVPARVPDLSRLPPTFIGTGAVDLFVEEDVQYANRLMEAGVPVELLVVPGGYHAFDLIATDATATHEFHAAQVRALRRAFSS